MAWLILWWKQISKVLKEVTGVQPSASLKLWGKQIFQEVLKNVPTSTSTYLRTKIEVAERSTSMKNLIIATREKINCLFMKVKR